MDILEELPVEKWPILQDKLKSLWPLNVPGYYTLHFKVYCPYGDVNNGFVGINVKNYQDIILFSVSEDTSKLEEALIKTRFIDWSRPVNIDIVTSLTLGTLQRVHNVMKFERFFVARAKMYHLPGNTELFSVCPLPDNTVMKSVKSEDIQRVNDTWPYKYPYSETYFRTLASNGLSYGLYSCDTDKLLAWMFINEYNFLCHMYCEENQRRRGYGQYVMQCAVNDLLKNGNDVYGYVVDGNEKPLAIFGFEVVDNGAFLIVENPVNKVV